MFPKDCIYLPLKRLIELEEKIEKKRELIIGDPDFIEYYRLIGNIQSFSAGDLIDFTRELERRYESRLQDKLSKILLKSDNLERTLGNLGELIAPYLPKSKK